MENLYTVIMAGGVGSRFWPQSSTSKPKQFLDILGCGKSLLQLTFDRMNKIIPTDRIYVVTVSEYAELVQGQLPELTNANIIYEPSRNNTAPCVTYAAYKIHIRDENSVLAIVPADHSIEIEDVYLEAVLKAADFAQVKNAIVTLGISPTRPDTGYGYIKYGEDCISNVYKVERFVEKPSLERAIEYLRLGCFLWNAGIFVSRSKELIDSIKRYAPEVSTVFENGIDYFNSELEKKFFLENYSKCPNISFDYAVAEKAGNVYTIPVNCGWSDLGTWNSLFDVVEKNEDGIFFQGGFIEYNDTKNCLIRIADNKAIVIKGLNDYVIVDTEKALLIYPRNNEQEIKEVTERIKRKGMCAYL